MIVAIDIGNTDVVIGVNAENTWIQNWRTPSNVGNGIVEYETILRSWFLEAGMTSTDIEGAVISSVVPDLTMVLVKVISTLTGYQPVVVDSSTIVALDLGPVINPHQIGSDLVANAVGAFDRFQTNAIVVDFGTALTFTSIDEKGEMMGVAISPGVRTAMKSLSSNTAKLPEIPLEIPHHIFGKNTIEAMQAGIMQGYVGLVRHMVSETKKVHAKTPKVIATGGLSFAFEPLQDVFDEIDVNLTLNGLMAIYKRLN